jgi:hypothetical protein
MTYFAGLSWRPGTAASAALKPAFECVPSQKGLVIEPPQRHSANGLLGIWYGAPFQATSITSSPSTKYGPFCRTFCHHWASSGGLEQGVQHMPSGDISITWGSATRKRRWTPGGERRTVRSRPVPMPVSPLRPPNPNSIGSHNCGHITV